MNFHEQGYVLLCVLQHLVQYGFDVIKHFSMLLSYHMNSKKQVMFTCICTSSLLFSISAVSISGNMAYMISLILSNQLGILILKPLCAEIETVNFESHKNIWKSLYFIRVALN